MSLRVIFLSVLAITSTSLSAQQTLPDSHAPIGVMGDHLHEKGEFMVSLRTMQMQMEGNLQGSDSISPEEIVTTIPNRFANPPIMPPTLRVVPADMTTRMHMLGLMYAPTDRLTLMLMLNLVDKEMDHLTFQGGMGTRRLGEFTTETDGMGDSRLALLYGLYQDEDSQLILNLGLSIPTGDIEETDRILTPMGMTPSPRLPYTMQLGSGTWDLEPGITWKQALGDQWQWGAQIRYLTRLDENDEGYDLGDRLSWSNWLSYRFNTTVSSSVRLIWSDMDGINGIDPAIMLPVQTADPANSGGERWDLGLGLNFLLPGEHRISFEYERTVSQHVKGVQMEMDDMLTLGYQYAF